MKRAVVVTTRHRAVFFGYLNGDESRQSVVLEQCRMAVYWSADVRGVLGLASHGPSKSCRITHALTEPITIYDVTAIMGVSDEAAERWEAGPWS